MTDKDKQDKQDDAVEAAAIYFGDLCENRILATLPEALRARNDFHLSFDADWAFEKLIRENPTLLSAVENWYDMEDEARDTMITVARLVGVI